MRRNLKRKQPEDGEEEEVTTPKKQRITELEPQQAEQPEQAEDDEGSPTPKANGIPKTPTKSKARQIKSAESAKRADSSAKRKSASALLEYDQDGEDDDGFGKALAQDILKDDDDEEEEENEENGEVWDDQGGQLRDNLTELAESALQQETPSKKRGRGRPKGSKNRRSPTPEGDLPPQERYFFQNRAGPPEVSDNTLASLKLMTHDEYYGLMREYKDPHTPEMQYLTRLHARAFPQWRFEWHEGFNICLYGWGSKRELVNRFAEWLCARYSPRPEIVVVNGYTARIHIRTILDTLLTATAAVVVDGGKARSGARRPASQPSEMLDQLLSQLSSHPPHTPLMLLINSIDSVGLRRHPIQCILGRLAAHPSIHILATTDTPTFPLIWDSKLSDQFAFVYHDCTTYAPYNNAELNIVDDVHELLGRKGRRVGGGDGVGFVLKSLTENSRKLYQLLLTEILNALADGAPMAEYLDHEEMEDDMGQADGMKKAAARAGRPADTEAGEIGIEYKTLYQKASENFVCSSEMNFRTLLKEFYDHQMIVSRKEGSGAAASAGSGVEILGVPLSRDEMESLLEDLV